jgi:excisionase family DNA binding protein
MEERTELYTTREAAEQLSLSDSYLRRLIKQGKATPAMQIGGTWVFTKEEIDRLHNRHISKGGRPRSTK